MQFKYPCYFLSVYFLHREVVSYFSHADACFVLTWPVLSFPEVILVC